jgi:hypothetical protein
MNNCSRKRRLPEILYFISFGNPSKAALCEKQIVFWYIIPTRCTSHRVYFYLKTALHVSGVTITHLQEHKTTASTAPGNHYTVIDRVKFTDKEYR